MRDEKSIDVINKGVFKMSNKVYVVQIENCSIYFFILRQSLFFFSFFFIVNDAALDKTKLE